MATKENKKTVKPVKAENLKLKVALKKPIKTAAKNEHKCKCSDKKQLEDLRQKADIAATALRAIAAFLTNN